MVSPLATVVTTVMSQAPGRNGNSKLTPGDQRVQHRQQVLITWLQISIVGGFDSFLAMVLISKV